MKPSRTRVKSPGWAAFNLKQQENAGGQLEETRNDPFPPVSAASTSLDSRGNGVIAKKKLFSSVLLPTAEFPTLVHKKGNDLDSSLQKLKELHGWADSFLVEDIVAAADGDVEKASSLLKEMYGNTPCNNGRDEGVVLSGNTTDLAAEIADLSSTIENALSGTRQPLQFDDATMNMERVLQHLRSIPSEPEWEEGDIYLSRRKDAIKMMRSAPQHSRAATNAFLRNDHISAREHSLKAQGDWMAAEKLNAKAAREILSVRNNGGNPWKLDLHGLHASEAVQALKEHLYKIDFAFGVGNHSRGEAALPSAVRSFLNENGYRSDETRAGVISVWPKFRVR